MVRPLIGSCGADKLRVEGTTDRFRAGFPGSAGLQRPILATACAYVAKAPAVHFPLDVQVLDAAIVAPIACKSRRDAANASCNLLEQTSGQTSGARLTTSFPLRISIKDCAGRRTISTFRTSCEPRSAPARGIAQRPLLLRECMASCVTQLPCESMRISPGKEQMKGYRYVCRQQVVRRE